MNLLQSFIIVALFAFSAYSQDRPNFILFITDDISAEDLGCYGNTLIKTPYLDQMATEGVRFDQAYLTISSCSPSRCSLITGRYPHNTGAPELHIDLPAGQPLFPKLLREAGYYTAISGKHHMGTNADPAFVQVSKGQGPGLEGDWVQLLRDRPKDQPFFFWFASIDAHRGWIGNNEAPKYDPANMRIPPYLVDGPETRQDFADYYHEVSRTDHYLGKLREELERQGVSENTCVIYMSDNGRPFPRCKTRLYDSGIRTPLLIAMPNKIGPSSSVSLVSVNLDIGPTVLEMAGIPRDKRMQGVSLVPVLSDPTATVRDYAFAEHNWHVHQAHERMARHGDWLYIRNAWPERQAMCVESSPKYPSGKELWAAQEQGKLTSDQRDIFQIPRPAEELYRVSVDPHQLSNVAQAPDNQAVLAKLRAALDRWTEETGDTVPENPTNDREDAFGKKNAKYKLGTFPGTERNATSIEAPGPIRGD